MSRVLVLGGVESVNYQEVGNLFDVRVDYIPKIKKVSKSKVSNYDAVICLTAQVSHVMMRGLKKIASNNQVPVYYLRSSSKTMFTCFLQKHCKRKCPLNS